MLFFWTYKSEKTKRCPEIYILGFFSYVVILALVSPVGIVIGMIVTNHVTEGTDMQTLVIGILQGMAGGTLLYITFFEVLEKEKLDKAGMSGLLGFCFLFLGFSLMAGISAIGKK